MVILKKTFKKIFLIEGKIQTMIGEVESLFQIYFVEIKKWLFVRSIG
jgi:hypothetical protein